MSIDMHFLQLQCIKLSLPLREVTKNEIIQRKVKKKSLTEDILNYYYIIYLKTYWTYTH